MPEFEKIPVDGKQYPREVEPVRLFLEDGTTVEGVWTGKIWWSRGAEVFPTHWQRMWGPTMSV